MMLPQRLDRWIIFRYLTAVLIVVIVLAGLYVVGDLSQHVDEILRGGSEKGWVATAYVMAGYYAMGVVRYFFEYPDLIFVGAAAALMVGLLRSGEAAAVQGMGRSLRRLTAPVLWVVAGFCVIQLVASEGLLPLAVMKEEGFGAQFIGRRAMSGVVFPAEGADAVVGVGYAGEEGRVRDMVVMERGDDGFQMVRVQSAAWSSKGELRPDGEVETLLSAENRAVQVLDKRLNITPAAALRLRMLGPSAVRMHELLSLGGGRMLTEFGSRIGDILLLMGAVMVVLGLLARSGGETTAGRGVAVFLGIEAAIRIGDAVASGLGAATAGEAALVLGMSAGLLTFAAGTVLFSRMPT